jgi:hypothetical protein
VFLLSGMGRVMLTFMLVFDEGEGGFSVNRDDELGRASYEAYASRVGGRVEVKVVPPGDVVGWSWASPLLYERPLVTQIST